MQNGLLLKVNLTRMSRLPRWLLSKYDQCLYHYALITSRMLFTKYHFFILQPWTAIEKVWFANVRDTNFNELLKLVQSFFLILEKIIKTHLTITALPHLQKPSSLSPILLVNLQAASTDKVKNLFFLLHSHLGTCTLYFFTGLAQTQIGSLSPPKRQPTYIFPLMHLRQSLRTTTSP